MASAVATITGFWGARRLALPLFVALAVFAMFFGLSPGLADPDWWWHLETGKLILAGGAIPETDPFSWTFQGEPWTLQSWAFQLGLAWLWQLGGEGAVAAATAALLALAWWVAFATADRMIKRPALVVLLSLLLAAGIVGGGAPRPQLISYLAFALLLAAFFHAKYSGRSWPLLSVPVIMIVWVNCHGGFVLGVAAIVALCVLEWAQMVLGRRDGRQLRLCLWLTLTAAASVAATGVNPWGYAHWAYPLYVAQLDLAADIVEWQSIMTSPLRGPWYALGGVLFFVILARARQRPDLVEMLFPAALFVAGLMQARHAPFAGMAMLVFAAPALWRDRAGPAPLPVAARLAGWVIALAGLATPALLVQGPYRPAIEQVMPSDVTAFIAEERPAGRMFNDYAIGGYLIHRLGSDRLVFIDGRADLYGDAFYGAYAATISAAVPPAVHFDGWNIGYAVLRPSHALTKILTMRGWRIAFRGRSHLVLVAPGG
ncbi:MAG: hypothetical protein AAF674_05685 [Pseudomonadota bacterium]